MIIKLSDIRVSFGEKIILDSLYFEFEKGKKYAIMGASGVGKTTILNLISGLIKPNKGQILNSFQKTSYVFQEPRLFDWLNVLDNVTLVMETSNQSRAKEILIGLGLGDSLSLYPSELSGGMKQRVALARAIAYEPDVVLMDEPFRALDENTSKKVAEYVFSSLDGKTVIFVTHDENDIKYSDILLRVKDFPITQLYMEKSNNTLLE